MIIGISGKKQHGKDTVAKIIQYITDEYFYHGKLVTPIDDWSYIKNSNYSHHYIKKQFTYKLKQIVCLLICCTIEQLEDNDFKEKELGEEWRIWYWNYQTSFYNTNPRGIVSPLFSNYEEAINWESSNSKLIPSDSRLTDELLTPRKLLQLLGTECGRQIIHPNIWANALLSDYTPFEGEYIEHVENGIRGEDGLWYMQDRKTQIPYSTYVWREKVKEKIYPKWIITDVRFENEINAIRNNGGIMIIRVNRPGMPNNDKHESETALDNYTKFDYFIDNSGTVDDLISIVKDILKTSNII